MAKKFKFKLESFLKLKSFNVTKAEDALNKILILKYEKEVEIVSLYDEISELNNNPKKQTIIDLQSRFHRKIFLEDRIVQIRYEITKIVEIENFKRKELQEAMKDEKILEKLKEKKQVEFKFETGKEEDLALDEISIVAFGKKLIAENSVN
ncbi:MAG: flagellar FliJ family protein [Candidatus Kapaibacteriota bacterium]|jgi:flagellar export protein FliJ